MWCFWGDKTMTRLDLRIGRDQQPRCGVLVRDVRSRYRMMSRSTRAPMKAAVPDYKQVIFPPSLLGQTFQEQHDLMKSYWRRA